MFFDPPEESQAPGRQSSHWISFAIAFLALSLFVYSVFTAIEYQWNWELVFSYQNKFLFGWLRTLGISVVALFASLLVGAVAALAQRSRFLPLKYASTIYIELVRGTPLLVQILFFFYVVANSFGLDNRYVVGVLALALFSGAYIAEIFRGGIESVGKTQLQSAHAIGFSAAQTYRYVIFPQALRRSLPALAGQMATIIKDSSLLSVIAISEFTLNARDVSSLTYSAFETYFLLAIGYLALTLPIMQVSRIIEKRIRFET